MFILTTYLIFLRIFVDLSIAKNLYINDHHNTNNGFRRTRLLCGYHQRCLAVGEGSIHVISVNNFYQKEKQFIVAKYDGHFFVGPDNGVFSLLFDPMPEKVYSIPCKNNSTFPFNEVYAHAVAHILSEKPFSKIGKKVDSPLRRISLQPVTSKSQIRGSVIHIDHYGNVILNIKKDLFERIQSGRSFSLFFKRYDPIKLLSEDYSDVPIGDTLCLFNSVDYLEIAINMGRAANLLGLKVDDTVQIDFHDKRQSRKGKQETVDSERQTMDNTRKRVYKKK